MSKPRKPMRDFLKPGERKRHHKNLPPDITKPGMLIVEYRVTPNLSAVIRQRHDLCWKDEIEKLMIAGGALVRGCLLLAVALLAGLAGGCSSRPSFVTMVAIGPQEFALHGIEFRARFPQFSLDRVNGFVLGVYEHSTGSIYIVAADPYHLDDGERGALLHEEAHRIEDQQGWIAARPLWARLHREFPGMLTHPEIVNRLEAEGWLNL